MIEIGSANEADMVLAFLQAEIDSPRFGKLYHQTLRHLNLSRRLIDEADLSNATQNSVRQDILGQVRGYGRNQYLFSGFPADVRWRRVTADAGDFVTMRYANEPTWIGLSNGTRLVSEGAQNIQLGRADPTVIQTVTRIAAALKQGTILPELIAVETNSASLILVEGHSRATAYAVNGSTATLVIVGSSRSMPAWRYF
jgi:hypothetical protein